MAKKPKQKKQPPPGEPASGGEKTLSSATCATKVIRAVDGPLAGLDLVYDRIEEDPPMPPEAEAAYRRVHPLVYTDPAAAVAGAEPLVERWPDVPQVGNLMTVAYLKAGMMDRADAFIEEQFVRFPTYLYAQVNYAGLVMRRGQAAAVPTIMGGDFDLRRMYPHRTRFHINEVVGLYGVLANFLIETGDLEGADYVLAVMEQFAPGHPATEQAIERIELAVMQQALADVPAALFDLPPARRRKPAAKRTTRKGKTKGGPDLDARSA